MKFEWIALRILLIALAFFLGVIVARAAEPYGYGGIGQSNGSLVDKPGLWRHEGQPYTTDLTSMAFKAGLGLRHESGFFAELGYVDPGSFSINSHFASDSNYDPETGQCRKRCDQLHELNLTNDLRGGELVVGYQHTFLDTFQPYVKGGIAGFAHEHSGTLDKYGPTKIRHFDSERNNMGQNFSGLLIAGAVGGGMCTPLARVQLCGDVTYYHPVATTANPLVDSFVITTAQVKVPLSW